MSDVTASPTANELTAGAPSWWRFLVWAAALLLLAVLGWGLLNTTRTRPEAGNPAPDFEMLFYDGYDWEGRPTATLADMRGKVVILNFWASWCVECRLEAALLEDTWRAYADDGVVFVGVAYVDVESKARAYMQEFNITYPNAPDLRGQVSKKYKITGVPETFYIDRNGQIVHVTIGPVRAAEMSRIIESLLAEPMAQIEG